MIVAYIVASYPIAYLDWLYAKWRFNKYLAKQDEMTKVAIEMYIKTFKTWIYASKKITVVVFAMFFVAVPSVLPFILLFNVVSFLSSISKKKPKEKPKQTTQPKDPRNTVLYWLNQIEDDIVREVAIDQVDDKMQEAFSISDAIIKFRKWSYTKEGSDYWEFQHNYYKQKGQ